MKNLTKVIIVSLVIFAAGCTACTDKGHCIEIWHTGQVATPAK